MEIIVVQIKNVSFHPDVLVHEGVYIYEVHDGEKTYSVICNAKNVKIGMFTLLAPVGSMTPRGLLIKKNNFKGVISEGILCTEKDLDLESTQESRESRKSNEEEGIIDLPPSVQLGIMLKELPKELLSSTPWYQYKLVDTMWENKLTKKLLMQRVDEPTPSGHFFRKISQTYYRDGQYVYRSFLF